MNRKGNGGCLGLCLRDKRKKKGGGPLKRGDKGTNVELLLQNLPRLPFEEQIGFLSEFLNT